MVEDAVRARLAADNDKSAAEAGDAAIYLDFATARAKKESVLAQQAELDLRVRQGQLVERVAVREASAAAMAACSQTLRSIPDTIERKLGVSPAVAHEIALLIDESLNSLADELDRMSHDGF